MLIFAKRTVLLSFTLLFLAISLPDRQFVFLFSTFFQLTRLFATRRLFALRMFYIGAHQPLFLFPFLFTLLLLLLLLSIRFSCKCLPALRADTELARVGFSCTLTVDNILKASQSASVCLNRQLLSQTLSGRALNPLTDWLTTRLLDDCCCL